MRSMRFVVGALICALSITLSACQKQKQWINITGPDFLPQCSDRQNNDPWEDNLIDAMDPGCHPSDRNPGNPRSYDPNHNDERDNPTAPPAPPTTGPNLGPGPFSIDMNSIRCPRVSPEGDFRVSFSWSGSAGAVSYRVERRGGINSRGTWDFQDPNNPEHFVSFNGNLFVQSRVRPDFSYDYRVWAVNSFGQRLGNPEEFHACDAVFIPPVITTPPPSAPTPPGPSTPPGTTTPPGGGGNAIRITGPPSSGTGAFGSSPGATGTATAECSTNGGATWGSCANPWWFSHQPSRIQIHPTNGFMQRLAAGSTTICVQWSQTQTSPSACRTY